MDARGQARQVGTGLVGTGFPTRSSASENVLADAWLVSGDVRLSLAELDAQLAKAVQTENRELAEMALRLVGSSGKRLRPALVLLAAEFGDADRERTLRAAAGVELLHIGSLYHDDIIDRAALRRGVPAASKEWGAALAAAAGTFVTTRGVHLFAVEDSLISLVSHALLELCTGQLREAQNAFRLDLRPHEHLEIVAQKTASLFQLSSEVGVTVARLGFEHTKSLAKYAAHLGIAFQLADDALDLQGDPLETGKPTGTDVRAGAYSLPILLGAQAEGPLPEELRRLLRKVRLGNEDLRAIVRLLHASGAIAGARKVADRHRDGAIDALNGLPEGPAKESLLRLAVYSTSRLR